MSYNVWTTDTHTPEYSVCRVVTSVWSCLLGWVQFFPLEDGLGLVPKRGCLLTLAYYAFPR
jgi:hypothetical protein